MEPIVITGPTCTGKTSASILLAKHLGGEIISADSMQIYKNMDIGTAKPTPEETSKIKHHMIDIKEPWETFSCGEYVSMVKPIIENLIEKSIQPIIVGGSGLYIRAITEGLFKAPQANLDIRTNLLELERQTPGFLYDSLQTLDSVSAKKINPNDFRRIVRALEVRAVSGINISELQKTNTTPLPFKFKKICLIRQREELYELINKRVDKMISNGFITEVKKLSSINMANSPSQAIGYKEIGEFIKNKIPLDNAISETKKNTRRYAKRQITWFRQEKSLQWIDVTDDYEGEKIFQKIITSL